MRLFQGILCLALSLIPCLSAASVLVEEKLTATALKAVELSTLDQEGTGPFHLKATYSSTFERERGSHREGEIEIWWESPTTWRRELRAPGFHQIGGSQGGRQWQRNEGDFYPNWLRELYLAIIHPMPMSRKLIEERISTSTVRLVPQPGEPSKRGRQINFDWDTGDVLTGGKGYLALLNEEIFYTGGPGFGGLYKDFKNFHGRKIARTVSSGSPEVTAKINILEDLDPQPSGFFDPGPFGTNSAVIDTIALNEDAVWKNVSTRATPVSWPPAKDGPLEGVVWTEVVIDRSGKIQEMMPPISDNGWMSSVAADYFHNLQFKPFFKDGIPVQVTGKLSLRFKTTRPAGMEVFDSAKNYFEKGRRSSFLAYGAKQPYRLTAEFQIGTPTGIMMGTYEDTWISPKEWRRELRLPGSYLIRTQVGEQHYAKQEGEEGNLLKTVMSFLEPIPAADTMTESDWRIRRENVAGESLIRVARGPEGPNGELDVVNSLVYWFNADGLLMKTYFQGFELRPSKVEAVQGVQLPKQIDALKNGRIGLHFVVKDIVAPDPSILKEFELKGHESKRQFTMEVR